MNDQQRDALISAVDATGAETKAALHRFMDDKEMYCRYLSGFPNEGSMPRIAETITAVEGGQGTPEEWLEVEKAVHSLKGVVINLGLYPFADDVMELLSVIRDEEYDEVDELWEEVQKGYARICEVIRANS